MRILKFLPLTPLAAALSIFPIQPVDAQELKIGGQTTATILQTLGARMEHGASSEQLAGYSQHFKLIDKDGDGKHSKVEYIEKGNYLTPKARRGIFNAADHDKDGFVTAAEYTLNRIITDEGKAILQAMDDDKDGTIQQAEFKKHAAAKLSDPKLANEVFAALDTNKDGSLLVPEYLRVWGQWARASGKPAKQRLEEAAKSQASAKDEAKPSAPGRSFGPPVGRGGPPERGAGGFGPFSGNTDPVRLGQAGLKVGSTLPDLTVFTADGKPFKTASLKGKHTVLVFGCLT